MYAVMGITGQVGGAVARALLKAGQKVRAVVRDEAKGAVWRNQGCEVAVADIGNPYALRDALSGAQAVFAMLPPLFDPAPGYPEASAMIRSLRAALEVARPAKVVALSTIGAAAAQPNLLNQLGMLEHELRELPMPAAFVRAAWFMENFAWDIATARSSGTLHSYLQPLDRAIPMIATADVGATAAALMQEDWQGKRIVELEAREPVSPAFAAQTLGRVLGRDVRPQAVPRDSWQALFAAQGMQHPLPRIQMLDGFNQGWIAFDGQGEQRYGETTLETVLAGLAAA
ncbi:NmrA family NAD(P)-binding protein [Massilia sp. SM-13]|uniref:NmrA family NAD(P)-binding protein n=1 Tax=Pseudoduganella rhizocola TaxID=3382643 RepID=UPI0038B51FFE